MNILISPDSFKENLTAIEIATIISKSIKKSSDNENTIQLPISDGGDGFSAILDFHLKLKTINITSADALMRSIKTTFLYNKKTQTAFIESANSIGLHLLSKKEKNPLKTTSFGLGILIKSALDLGVEKIIIGLGGSSTNDAGIGMLKALGVKFYNNKKEEINTNGENLNTIHSIDIQNFDKRIKNTQFIAACDVENPFFGLNGAAYTYAAQKGAKINEIKILDNGLKNFSNKVKELLNIDISELKGGGAAGGIAASLFTFFNAELKSGFEIISGFVNLEEQIRNSDIVISAEGKIDNQTKNGKLIGKLATLCKKHEKTLIIFTGNISGNLDELYQLGVTSIFSIQNSPMSKTESFEKSRELLESTVKNVFNLSIC